MLVFTDEAAMDATRGRFNPVLDTIPVKYEIAPYLSLVGIDRRLRDDCDPGYQPRL